MGSYYPTDYVSFASADQIIPTNHNSQYTPEPNRQYQEQYSYRPQDPRYLVSASHSYTHTGGPISRSTSYFSNESGYPQYSASSSTSPQPPYAYPSTYQSSNTVPDVELTYGATIKSSNRQNKSPRLVIHFPLPSIGTFLVFLSAIDACIPILVNLSHPS